MQAGLRSIGEQALGVLCHALDPEERRKRTLLLMAMSTFGLHATFLVLSPIGYEDTFLRGMATGFLTLDVFLFVLLCRSPNLVVATGLFTAVVDSSTVAICFNSGPVPHLTVWLLIIPALLLSILVRRVGLGSVVIVVAELIVLVSVTGSGTVTPRHAGALIPPLHELIVAVLPYAVVGGAALLHEGSTVCVGQRASTLEQGEAACNKLQKATKTRYLANFSHGMPSSLLVLRSRVMGCW